MALFKEKGGEGMGKGGGEGGSEEREKEEKGNKKESSPKPYTGGTMLQLREPQLHASVSKSTR